MTNGHDKTELTPNQKTQLLNLALEKETEDQNDKEVRADMLYDLLKRPLPMNESTTRMLPPPLRGLSRRVHSITNAPLLELLTDSNTDISTMEKVKEYAKKSDEIAKYDAQTEILLVIYYAAIANGLLFHNRKITEHSYRHLIEAFGSISEKDWVPQELTDLVKKAQEYSQSRLLKDQ